MKIGEVNAILIQDCEWILISSVHVYYLVWVKFDMRQLQECCPGFVSFMKIDAVNGVRFLWT